MPILFQKLHQNDQTRIQDGRAPKSSATARILRKGCCNLKVIRTFETLKQGLGHADTEGRFRSSGGFKVIELFSECNPTINGA